MMGETQCPWALRQVSRHFPKELLMKRKNTPLFILFFDETMTDIVKASKYGGLGRHRFVIILSSKMNDDRNWDQKTRNANKENI